MVCLGNICRSPMAEGILRHKVHEAGLDIEIDSAGTSNQHRNQHPDWRAVKCLNIYGIDISKLRARQFNKKDFEAFDILFTMDKSNHENVLKLSSAETDRAKVKMLLNEYYADKNMEVPDPWFGEMDGFHAVYHLLNDACDALIEKLKQNEL